MATIDAPRHQIIKRAVRQRPEADLDVTIHLWERLASELISIIGEGGFQSLYARSIHLTKATFPWLVLSHPSQQTDSRFAALKTSLDGRDFTEACEAQYHFADHFHRHTSLVNWRAVNDQHSTFGLG
jgi:hypothetical protein